MSPIDPTYEPMVQDAATGEWYLPSVRGHRHVNGGPRVVRGAHVQAVLDRIARDTGGAMTAADMPRGAIARLDAWLTDDDWSEAQAWLATYQAAQAELAASTVGYHEKRRKRELAMLEDAKRQKRDLTTQAAERAAWEAQRAAREALQARRDAELVELAAGYDAVNRLGRLEGKLADIEVLAKPYAGIKSIERDNRGRIKQVVRAR